MTMFFLLIAVTLVAGLGVAYLLNKWFRSDMERCRTDITADASGSAGGAASSGPPVPKLSAKLYGAVGVFAVVVMFVGGAGLYQLNRNLKMQDAQLKIQEKKLEEMEKCGAKVSVRLESGKTINPANLTVKVAPPAVGLVPGPAEDSSVQFVVHDITVRKPASGNLPTLTVSYPGYEKRDVDLTAQVLFDDSCYDTVKKIVTVPVVITLTALPQEAETTIYKSPPVEVPSNDTGPITLTELPQESLATPNKVKNETVPEVEGVSQ